MRYIFVRRLNGLFYAHRGMCLIVHKTNTLRQMYKNQRVPRDVHPFATSPMTGIVAHFFFCERVFVLQLPRGNQRDLRGKKESSSTKRQAGRATDARRGGKASQLHGAKETRKQSAVSQEKVLVVAEPQGVRAPSGP